MTEYEKRSITNMRLQGKGYRSIASELGLSRDAVRNFCKSRKIDGYACSKDTGIINPLLWGKTICPTCGEPFEQPEIGRKRKYCSEECRRRYWSVHPEKQKLATHTFVCQYFRPLVMTENFVALSAIKRANGLQMKHLKNS